MNKLNGYKTYIICGILVVYALGSAALKQPMDERLFAMLAAAAVASMRYALTDRPPTQRPPTP